MSASWQSFQLSLPDAPDVDVKQICGNISDAEKQVNANVFHYFCTGSDVTKFPAYNSGISGRLKMLNSMYGITRLLRLLRAKWCLKLRLPRVGFRN
jgi:hypothetical protein